MNIPASSLLLLLGSSLLSPADDHLNSDSSSQQQPTLGIDVMGGILTHLNRNTGLADNIILTALSSLSTHQPSYHNIFNTVAVGEVLPVAILASTRQQGPVWIQTAWNNKSSLAEQNHDLYPGNSYNLSGYIIVLYCEGWVSKWYIILKYTLFTASLQPTCRQKCTIHYCLHHFAWCSGQAAAGESCSAPPCLPASLLPNYSFI